MYIYSTVTKGLMISVAIAIITLSLLEVGLSAYTFPAKIRVLRIYELSGKELIDYPVRLRLTLDDFPELSSIDPGTIYFTTDEGTPLYYWIENYDSSEIMIWIKIPRMRPYSVMRLFMIYGGNNPYRGYNDPRKVFLFYDDFTDVPRLIARHFDSTGNVVLVDGWLRVDSEKSGDYWNTTDTGSGVFIPIHWSEDFVIETRFRQQFYPSTQGLNKFLILRKTLDADSAFFGLMFDYDSTHVTILWRNQTSLSVSWAGEDRGCARDPGKAQYYARIYRIGGDKYYAYFSNDGVSWCLLGNITGDFDGYIGLIDSGHAGYTEYDYIRVARITQTRGESIYFYYGNPDAISRSNGTATFIFFEDFTSNPNVNGNWIIYRYANDFSNEFSWDPANRRLFLVRAVRGRGVMAFFRNVTSGSYLNMPERFIAVFYGRAGGGTGADGFAFAFFKDPSPYEKYGRAGAGGSIGLVATDAGGNTYVSDGYAVEFDNFLNSPGDPSSNHNALVRTNIPTSYVHLAYVNTRVGNEDNIPHRYEVLVDSVKGFVQLKIDDSLTYGFTYAGFLNSTYKAGGFSSATGYDYNNHLIERFVYIRAYTFPEPYVSSWDSEESPLYSNVWLEGWYYRKRANIIGSLIEPVTDYQIKLTIYYGSGVDFGDQVYCNGKCRPDFSDIRFTTSDGVTELPYWIEEKVDGVYAKVWVKIPYVEPGVTVNPVEMLYYEFDSFNETSNWLIYSNDYVFEDNVLCLRSGGFELIHPLSYNLGVANHGYIVEVRVRLGQAENGVLTGAMPLISSSQSVDFSGSNIFATVVVAGRSDTEDLRVWIADGSMNGFNVVSNASIGLSLLKGSWYVVGVGVLDKSVSIWVNYDHLYSASVETWQRNPLTFIKLGHPSRGEDLNIQDTSYGWVRVRKFIAPEPAVILTEAVEITQTAIETQTITTIVTDTQTVIEKCVTFRKITQTVYQIQWHNETFTQTTTQRITETNTIPLTITVVETQTMTEVIMKTQTSPAIGETVTTRVVKARSEQELAWIYALLIISVSALILIIVFSRGRKS